MSSVFKLSSPTPSERQTCALLPLRDVVVFPRMVVPLSVGREKSVRALEQACKENDKILLVAQKDSSVDKPTAKDLYTIGVMSKILHMVPLPDGTLKALVEGHQRARLFFESPKDKEPDFLRVSYLLLKPEQEAKSDELQALMRSARAQFEKYAQINANVPEGLAKSLHKVEDGRQVADIIAQHLHVSVEKRQTLLSLESVAKRFQKILEFIESEMGLIRVERKIRTRVKRQVEKSQREYYLNEQMKAIQKELGEGGKGKDDIEELEIKINALSLSQEAREKCESEIKKLKQMSSLSAEATVVRNYLDWVLSLPWQERSTINTDLKSCKTILDEDHYGLDEVKERILDYLAVQSRVKIFKGPILCLVGPPGVGKTSLGKSIARAIGRVFVRISLGGIRDEAEIRGHRKTYVGAMPGKILQGMKKAKVSDPFFLLDEIDKIGTDWRGDPTSALLEVLDPEQNHAFNDHYLEVDYDLSECMFVTTANTLNMPQPLIDRMEIVRIPGYTEEEKIQIGKRHLMPKMFEQCGVEKREITISDSALKDIIRYYTREAGARNLERAIARITRKSIRKISLKERKRIAVTDKNLDKFLGVRKYRFGETEKEDLIGIATGLAWTEVGGELLTIEAVTSAGKGKITQTGKLGDIMRESIQAAQNYIKSRSRSFGIPPELFEKTDIHVHVPEGATPKDGPSAGIAIATALVSVLTNIPVKRTVAMTGEITLRGRVLPIGGLKEKLLAALRGSIKTVVIPAENAKDLVEIPDNVKKEMKIIPVESVAEVLDLALVRKVKALPQQDSSQEIKQPSDSPEDKKSPPIEQIRH